MTPFLKGIHDGQKFFVMNLVVNFSRKKLRKMKTNWMKKIIFSGCESSTPNAKSDASVSKTKGLERFA
jgi:hypothetical protein